MNDVALIGAVGDDGAGNHTGTAYVFGRGSDGWAQTRKLLASDGAGSDCFRQSLAVLGNTGLIGAPGTNNCGVASGPAYVFVFNSSDCNRNGVPDDCDVIEEDDFDGDGDVDRVNRLSWREVFV